MLNGWRNDRVLHRSVIVSCRRQTAFVQHSTFTIQHFHRDTHEAGN
jgi:hypothetical protein